MSETPLPGFYDFLGLERHACKRPGAIALAAPGRKPLTYAALWDHVQAIRHAFEGAGVRPGEVAALAMPNGPELITALLGISGIGAGAPLNPALTENELRCYLGRLGARILIIPNCADSPAAAAAQSLGIDVLRIASTPDDAAGVFSLETSDAIPPARSTRVTDAALLLFTSATTATPKLVPLTGEDLRTVAVRQTAVLRLSAADRFLSVMPLFHHYGLAAGLAQLFAGGAVISAPGFDPNCFMDWLENFQPSWLVSSPPLNRSILGLVRQYPEVFRRNPLRLIRCAFTAQTEALRVLEKAVGAPVLTGYGLTETGVVTLTMPGARKLASVGRAVGLELAIADPLGNLLGAEIEGEVIVRGPSITSGYLDDPEANEAAFRDGWFRTGDLGHLDSEGFLFLTGRLKEVINRGGEKIIPQEVDEALAGHPAVAEAAVFPVAHETLGEDVAAAVVLHGGAGASELELRRFAATRLATFKVPRRIMFVEALPRNIMGKPQRTALAEQFRQAVKKSI
jgi:acyl-CoA synthetase (AMP-forming)/AMP-acid ligase II